MLISNMIVLGSFSALVCLLLVCTQIFQKKKATVDNESSMSSDKDPSRIWGPIKKIRRMQIVVDTQEQTQPTSENIKQA